MTEDLPFSAAAERNMSPISQKLTELVTAESVRVLEVGSGTGQHVAFFAERFPAWEFQPSDQNDEYFEVIRQRISGATNVQAPIVTDLLSPPSFETTRFDCLIAINVFQVAPINVVEGLYKLGQAALNPGGKIITYSPLTHHGRFTSQGDASFDARLRDRDPNLGIRGVEELRTQAERFGFSTFTEHPMPANNWLTVAS